MVWPLFFYQLGLVALVWLCVMLHWAWASDPATACPTTLEPTPPATRPFSPTTAHRHDARTPPPGGDLHTFLPQPKLCLSGLGRLGQSPRQWPSEWRSLAATAVHRLSRLLSRDPWYDLSWQAHLCRAHCARPRVPGRRPGHPRHCTGVRGRPEYGAALVGRSCRA